MTAEAGHGKWQPNGGQAISAQLSAVYHNVIELVHSATESGEELAINTTSRSRSSSWSSEASVDATSWNGGAPQPVNEHEKDEVDSMAKLKERLQLAEKINSRLEQLYQKYRLRWLEESYRARVLEEYALEGRWNPQDRRSPRARILHQYGRLVTSMNIAESVTPKQNVEVSRMMRAPRWRLTCWSKINDPVQALALKYWMSFSPFNSQIIRSTP
ncbi:hypothetical protein C8R48DRAFT_673315 [Suillus tomentosus]|nr:hypothetical protein C8R48DRAFT_673315 [Suillus tomentosus]